MDRVSRNEGILSALNPLFWWAREPAVMASAIGGIAIAVLDYVEFMGYYAMENGLLALILSVLGSVGLVIRSQVSPVAAA
jgi:hypothetical protein